MKTWADFDIDVSSSASGEIATTCPQCSHTRKKSKVKCLSVNIEKEVWVCQHCDWRGTLKGGAERRSDPHAWKTPTFVRPAYVEQEPTDPVLTWCAGRGLTEETARYFGLTAGEAYFPDLEAWAPAILFPYYRGNDVINVKSRSLEGKSFRQVSGAEKIFFHLNASLGVTETCIVEGEPDAMACWQVGVQAMSVPDGAPALTARHAEKKYEYLLTCHDQLEPLTKIVLATDNDPPGEKLAQELARRLGVERCWRVHWPEGIKDANQCLLDLGPECLRWYLEHPTPWPIDDLVTVDGLAETLVNAVPPPPRLSTGWSNLDELWGFSSTDIGRLILVTGWPSHGKSEWVDALLLNTIQRYDWPWLICSPENMPPEEYVQRMIEREVGEEFYGCPPDRRLAAIERLAPYLFLLNPDEMIPVDSVLKAARALILRAGLRGIVIDPWNEFDPMRPKDVTETENTGVLLGRLRRFARSHGVNVVVVAHPGKLVRNKDGSYPKPTPRDVSGSAHWFNKPDDCLMVWRDTDDTSTQAQIHVQKVRGKRMGRNGEVALYWDRITGRYRERF